MQQKRKRTQSLQSWSLIIKLQEIWRLFQKKNYKKTSPNNQLNDYKHQLYQIFNKRNPDLQVRLCCMVVGLCYHTTGCWWSYSKSRWPGVGARCCVFGRWKRRRKLLDGCFENKPEKCLLIYFFFVFGPPCFHLAGFVPLSFFYLCNVMQQFEMF